MEKECKHKFYNSLELGIFILIFMSLCVISLIVLLFLPSVREQTGLWGALILLFFIVLGISSIIGASFRCFACITFDEKGIKKSVFGKFSKREILWAELKDIHVVWRMDNWYFFSKSEISNLSFEAILRRKDQIQLQARPKLREAIEHFYTKGNIPENLYIKIADLS